MKKRWLQWREQQTKKKSRHRVKKTCRAHSIMLICSNRLDIVKALDKSTGGHFARHLTGVQCGTGDKVLKTSLLHDVRNISFDLSPNMSAYRVQITLESNGWHIIYKPRNAKNEEPVLHYLVDPVNRQILFKTGSKTSNYEKTEQRAITSDQALKIARSDAEKVYRDLSEYSIIIILEQDGWHVDYELKNPETQGGGPHYIIDPNNGKILKKRYEQ